MERVTQQVKNYIEEKGISLELEFGNKSANEVLNDAVLNYSELSKLFILCYSNFERVIINSNIDAIKEFKSKYQKIFQEILRLRNRVVFGHPVWGKTQSENDLEDYITKNQGEIIFFIGWVFDTFEIE